MGKLKKRVATMMVITMLSMDLMVKATGIGGIAYEEGESYQSELMYTGDFDNTTPPAIDITTSPAIEITTAPAIGLKTTDLNYLLFSETFTGPDGQFASNETWDVQVHTDKGGQIDRKNESLHLSVAGNNVVYSKEEVARPTKDIMLNSEIYSVETNMTLGENHVKGSYFIGFAVNPVTKEGYELEYHQSGILRIVKTNSSSQHNGKSVNYPLNKGTTYNVKVIVYPSKVEVFVDDILVLEEQINQVTSIGRGISLRAQFAGQDVTFDDIEVRVDKGNPVYSVSSQASTDGEFGDISGGTLVLEKHISTGKEVALNPLVKNNYMLDSNEPFTFFNNEEDGKVDIEVVDGKFIMPSHSLTVVANFVSKPVVEEVVYYVDSVNGDDSNIGTSQGAPLKTIDRLNNLGLNPGDQLLFKAGSTFDATGNYSQGKYLFTPKGSGKEGNPIVIGVYGEGEKPRLNGCGVVETVIYLNNQEHIVIEGLEIINEDSSLPHTYELNQNTNTTKVLRGIHINAKDYGVVSNITLRDLYIHNINGKLNYKWNGGIFVNADGTIGTNQSGKRELIGIPTKYDGILIENNTFEKVDRSAIKLISSQWCNKSVTNDPTIPINWYPSTNVVVRGNYMDDIGGDGITVRDTDGALIEYNLVRESNKQEKITGYNVAIWPFQADNTVVQFNEAYLTYGLKDGQGFDADHLSNNSVIQYNYSHDNVGGFVLVMGWYQMYENINGSPVPTNETNPGVTIRYNISQNDLDHTFEITRGIPSGMSIYNNTIYLDQKLNVSVFDLAGYPNSESNLYEDFYVFNNVFYYDGEASGAKFYGSGDKAIEHLKEYGHFTHNAYYGITPPEEDKNPIVIQDGHLEFVDLGQGPGTDTGLRIPIAGKNLENKLDGYQLKENSMLIDAGLTIDDIYNEARHKDKILGTQKNPFKAINGVDYTKDFFGNEVMSNQSKPDIGAYEMQTYKWETINHIPEIKLVDAHLEYIELKVGDKFTPLEYVEVEDFEDGKIMLSENNVKYDVPVSIQNNEMIANKAGNFKVVYTVNDSADAVAIKEIDILVKAKSNSGGSDDDSTDSSDDISDSSSDSTEAIDNVVDSVDEVNDDLSIIRDSGYIVGYEDNTFRPNELMTRGEIAKIIAGLVVGEEGLLDTESFYKDVAESHFAYKEINYLTSIGIFSGKDTGVFTPNEELTRAQMAVILARIQNLAKDKDLGEVVIKYDDVDTNHWAYDSIQKVSSKKYMVGYDDHKFNPDQGITRAEAIAALNRIIKFTYNEKELEDYKMTFMDVPTDHWAYQEIIKACYKVEN